MKHIRGFLVALLCLQPVIAAAAAGEFHVAPGGRDDAAGTAEQPFGTVDRARRAVRELKEKKPRRDTPITVIVHGGTYYLDEPLVFEPADSGTAASPIIYQAADGERPILSGGVRITGFVAGEDGRWRVALPEVAEGRQTFSQLFVNDQRRFRPRLPADGYYKVRENLPPTEANKAHGFDRLAFTDQQVSGDWANLADVEVLGFHQWSASRMRIAAVDEASKVVTFTGPTRSNAAWNAFKDRFLVINVKEALDAAGEWYLDRPTGELTYIPREGEQPDAAVVIAPRLEQIVRFRGVVKQRKWVEHVQLRGLTFAHTAWALPPAGQSFPQAEVGLSAAVEAEGARHVAIEDCAVRHTGGYAMNFGPGCREIRVDRCEMIDLAAGGVKISITGGDWADEEARVSKVAVRDCTIAHGGRMHPAAVGVWIGHAEHCTIEHNDIHDFYYTGVSVGWSWGYAEPSRAHHNEIAWNDVHHIGQGVLSDMGGIYTLGVSPGTTIHHNIFHHIHAYDYGGWGLYTDEGSTGIHMHHNLVYETKTGSFHQHYGRDNLIENNVLVESKAHQLQRTRAEGHNSFTFRRNIVYWTNNSPLLGSNWGDNNYRLESNLYFNPNHEVRFPGNLTLEQWQTQRKQDAGSIIADPQFIDPAKHDYRLKENSPAKQIGFEAWDYGEAGRLTKRSLTVGLPAVPEGFQ